jgi:putative oxidoreductase
MPASLAPSRSDAASGGVAGAIVSVTRVLDSLPKSVGLLGLRAALAIPYFLSGLTKWDGFLRLSDTAVLLFTEEFKLNLFGAQVGFPFPPVTAFMAGVAEVVLPILLVLGLGTRFAAFGLLVMTGVIQLVYPDAWHTFHLPWAAMALMLVMSGGGKLSLDFVIGRLSGRGW